LRQQHRKARNPDPEKTKSVVIVAPKASDVNDEGLFEGLIRRSLVLLFKAAKRRLKRT